MGDLTLKDLYKFKNFLKRTGLVTFVFGFSLIIVPDGQTADLSITKNDSPDPVEVGQNLTNTITVTNNGPSDATGVTVTDVLFGSANFVSANASQGTGCSEAIGTVTCNLGTMSNGGNATVFIVVIPTAVGTISNSASVLGNENDPIPGNNDTGPVSTTVIPFFVDLSITTADNPDPVDVGLNLTYTITVSNNGPNNATGVTVTDVLSGSVNFVSANARQGTGCSEVSGTVTCNLGAISNGGNATITIVVMTTTGGDIGNTSNVSGNESDPDLSNNSVTENTNVGDVSRLTAISTRALVLTGADVAIGGFILEGNLPKTVLLRGRGPSMAGAPFNVPGTLSNPTLTLYSGPTPIAQNDNWGTTDPLCMSPATFCGDPTDISNTGLDPCTPNPGQGSAPPGCASESAILVTLPPGNYTAILSGVGGLTGVGLVEVFDPDTSTLPKMVAIATRGEVRTGGNQMIGGFIVGAGTGNKQVLIRARGPSLGGAPFNVPGALANPNIRLFSVSTVIAQNDDWGTTDPLCLPPAVSCNDPIPPGLDPCVPNPGQGVPPPNCNLEGAIVVTLPPGNYTAIMNGVGGGTGVGLMEVFELFP